MRSDAASLAINVVAIETRVAINFCPEVLRQLEKPVLSNPVGVRTEADYPKPRVA